MRIAHIGIFSRKKIDGVSNAVFMLADAQARLGHQVFFYGIGDRDYIGHDNSGIKIREFKKSSNPFQTPAGLERLIKEADDGIDIYHLYSVFIPSNFAVSNTLTKYNLPYIMTPHGGYDLNVFRKGRLKKWIYFQLFEHRCLQSAKAIITATSREVDDIQRLGYRKNIVVIPNGLTITDYSNFQRNPNASLVCIGRNDIHHKGLDRLLQVFAEIEKLDSSISLEIFSGDRHPANLEKIIQTLKLKRVHLNGPVFGDQKLLALSCASAYIQTSRWEAFGMTIAEAMMCGIPVVISRESYLSSTVKKLDCGLILDRYDENAARSLISLIQNKELNVKIGMRGKTYAMQYFDSNVVAQKTIDLYEEILS